MTPTRFARWGLVCLVLVCGAWHAPALSLFALAADFDEEASDPDTRERLYEQLQRDVEQLERESRIVRTVARLVGPTVVHIETKKSDRNSARFGGRRTIEETGSGVVIRHKGTHYVLTNWHVVKDANLDRITIALADGRELNPDRVWHDLYTDVAVMRIDGANLIAARVGDSDRLEIGDFVLAVGSPFGLSRSVTYGIISAKGRRDLELGDDNVRFQDFLQTDAAINPGNSGGPLISLRGEVVGINTAIVTNSGGNEGIGFSIPINMVMRIVEQLIEHGSVNRAYLGVAWDPAFGPAAAARIGLPRPRGVLINGITANSPAAAADLRVGDVILRFDGKNVDDGSHLQNLVSLTPINKEVPVVIFREGSELTVVVRVGDRNRFLPTSQSSPPAENENREKPASLDLGQLPVEAWEIELLGLTVAGLNPQLAAEMDWPEEQQGLLVTAVDPEGPAHGRVAVGEIIEQIDRREMRSIDDLETVLEQAVSGRARSLALLCRSSDRQLTRTVRLAPQLERLP